MLVLNTLFSSEDIDPSTVLIMRHRPTETTIRKVLPWIVAERPDLFIAYQQIQWPSAEKAMTRAKLLASFIGLRPGKAVFAGIYSIGAASPLTYEGYHSLPGNVELISLGMNGRQPDAPDQLRFEMELTPTFSEWIGRLIVKWPPPERAWFRWAARNQMPVDSILEESIFTPGMPHWADIALSWAELRLLPTSWRSALAEWRGVYFIFDVARRAGYVGSAYGADNLLGRWRAYAQTGHGGNKMLRQSKPDDLRFSILERTSPDMDSAEVIRLEANWKARLHTREFGLNEN
ncbi:MAG TPA: GIY-YIG nuclease family protein [Caulobacteraceae bacterium]|nr:GIY-YIG nuclease family protein [Caulobacteraceae bacterium]